MSILTATLSPTRVNEVLERLAGAARPEPDESVRRPAHVVYGGAHLYKAGTPAKLGELALASFDKAAFDPALFGRIVGLADPALAPELHARVRRKLASSPVESMCIDFEDGYGPRPDDAEDADAVRTATELAKGSGETAVGIRIKALSAATARRALRTLDLFLTTLGSVPAGFTVTLPKVTCVEEVQALVDALQSLEEALDLRWIGVELMVETPRALIDDEGRSALPALVRACGGRCVAAHLGAYDLTAALGVTAGDQAMDHPANDTARVMMQLALAGTGVAVYDGATTILPTGTDVAKIQDAWRLHATNVRRALRLGIYAGWDLHPAQLPARYGALFAFFLGEREAMATRLKGFVDAATRATRSGQVFDDAATGQGLVNFFLRGLSSGALEASDVAATGLTLDELRGRSFAAIVAARSTKEATP